VAASWTTRSAVALRTPYPRSKTGSEPEMARQTRQIYRRIQNVRHVHQITKAMYAIAAAQVAQRKRALAAARPHIEESGAALGRLWSAARAAGLRHPWFEPGAGEATALLVINTDRGLCGRYVGDVNRAAEERASELEAPLLLLGGEKAQGHFRPPRWEVAHTYTRAYERPDPRIAAQMRDDMLNLFPNRVKAVEIVYMRFEGELVQRVTREQVLPLDPAAATTGQLLAEPDVPALLNSAARVHLLSTVLHALLSAKASEHAIRRQAMKSATDNAEELLEDLTLRYNKARQHGITRELADIVGGSEALREGT